MQEIREEEVNIPETDSTPSTAGLAEMSESPRQPEYDTSMEKNFDPQETFNNLKKKILAILDKHKGVLSQMTRADFDAITGSTQNNPGSGDMLRLISQNFDGWSNQPVTEHLLPEINGIAGNMLVDIEAISDGDFFGDLQDIDNRKMSLNKILKNATNSKFAMVATIVQQQMLKRAQKYAS